MRIHVCWPWSEDGREGAPFRLYARTPWGFWIIALWPGSKVQVYDRKTKTYTDRWGWWSYRP